MTAPISNEPTTTRLHHYAGHYWAVRAISRKTCRPSFNWTITMVMSHGFLRLHRWMSSWDLAGVGSSARGMR